MQSVIRTEVGPAVKNLKATIDDYTAFRLNRIQESGQKGQALGHKSLWIIGSVSTISLVIGVGIGIFITRSITSRIALAIIALKKMEKGDYSFNVAAEFLQKKG